METGMIGADGLTDPRLSEALAADIGTVRLRELYEAVVNNDLEKIYDEFYSLPHEGRQRQQRLLQPLNVSGDTVLHIAVHHSPKLLRELLDMCWLLPLQESDMRDSYETDIEGGAEGGQISLQNVFGNTPLHEAAEVGRLEALQLLCGRFPYLTTTKNKQGETAAFRAAAFGQTEAVKFFFNPKIRPEELEYHCIRGCDSVSILNVAVVGQHMETALWIQRKVRFYTNSDSKYQSESTCLHLLANMPSVFASGYKSKARIHYPLSWVNGTFWQFLGEVCPKVNTTKIWTETRRHAAAVNLIKELVKSDVSWEHSSTKDIDPVSIRPSRETGNTRPESSPGQQSTVRNTGEESRTAPKTPLLMAASNGIIEIVDAILKEFPQAIEHIDPTTGENILHTTIHNRQWKIFCRVREEKIPMRRMALRLDNDGNTILHQLAGKKFYGPDAEPNPALQLQEELEWFEHVKQLIPTNNVMHRNKADKTAGELFEENHMVLVEKAQKWTKDASKSCSTIAALIATVVFAVAYSVPGSNATGGAPNFLKYPLFVAFVISDIFSLTSSLTSLVLFLSVLASPLHMQDFHKFIPQTLNFGFIFLFVSVATAMVAFTISVLLIIHHGKQWTITLISTIVLLAVSMFLLFFIFFAGLEGALRITGKRFK